MHNLYKLSCLCGLSIPVETNQAGRSLICSCGQQVQIPSLSEILKLEPMLEHEAWKTEKNRQPIAATSRSICLKHLVLVCGMVAMIVTSLLVLFGALFRPYWTTGYIPHLMTRYPQLHDVCVMQRHFLHGNKVVGRDTLPISSRDFRLLVDERIIPPQYGLLVWSEDVINRLPYIDYHPLILIEMHDNLKGGLELSYNFSEKYDKLVFYYWARLVVLGVLTAVSLVVLIVGIFLPKQVEDIGERGGESWE